MASVQFTNLPEIIYIDTHIHWCVRLLHILADEFKIYKRSIIKENIIDYKDCKVANLENTFEFYAYSNLVAHFLVLLKIDIEENKLIIIAPEYFITNIIFKFIKIKDFTPKIPSNMNIDTAYPLNLIDYYNTFQISFINKYKKSSN